MANIRKGEVEVELGGESRLLRFDMNALCELEEKRGQSILEILGRPSVQMRDIRDALFFGMKARDRKLTPERVAQLMNDDVLREGMGPAMVRYSAAIAKAVASFMGEDLDEGGDTPLAPAPAPSATPASKASDSTGSSSSA